MRSRKSHSLSDREVQELAKSWLEQAVSLKDSGPKCTATRIWQIVLLAAARISSLFAICADLANAPCDDSVRDGLNAGLPKRTRTLEDWMEPALCGQHLPKALFRRMRAVAIDWHLIPYHGEPQRNANELYHSHPKSGTTKFHAYATACIVEKGYRYTLAVTSVRGNESPTAVLQRLLDRLEKRGLRIKQLLLDRQFFTSAVVEFLQSRQIPFLMPLVLRGRKSKRRRKTSPQRSTRRPRTCQSLKLRDFLKKPAGRYGFTWTVKNNPVTFDVIVAYKCYRHHKSGRRRSKKLLYAAWRVPGAPVEVRELYRRRFGIESSYRQLGQARIRTCTRNPVERLFYVLVALVLRNVWVWLHFMYFAKHHGDEVEPCLQRLRFRRLLDWIARVIIAELHDGTPYSAQLQSG